MAMSYSFQLYCKGEQTDIDKFWELIEKAVADNEISVEESNVDRDGELVGRDFLFNETGGKKAYTPFLEFMEKFPNISFFFFVGNIESSVSPNCAAGYYIFKGSFLVEKEESDWFSFSDNYDGEEDNQPEAWEAMDSERTDWVTIVVRRRFDLWKIA